MQLPTDVQYELHFSKEMCNFNRQVALYLKNIFLKKFFENSPAFATS
jgi:hypothetical protein